MNASTVTIRGPERLLSCLQRLRAVLLLGGSVRPGRFGASIERPIFNLPLRKGVTILDSWRRETRLLGEAIGAEVGVRVLIDKASAMPAAPAESVEMAAARIEHDPFDYRGTGGVLRDIAGGYDAGDLLLVANAHQMLTAPLTDVAAGLAKAGGDVSIVSHADGTASGIFLVRCGALGDIPEAGFIDFKEQALPIIAKSHRVMVVHQAQPTGLPIRTLSAYLGALRMHHQRLAGLYETDDPFAESWSPAFGLVEDPLSVDGSARIHDSVVLRGGRVEAGAVIVNSVVCPGAVVLRGGRVIDDLAMSRAAARRHGAKADG